MVAPATLEIDSAAFAAPTRDRKSEPRASIIADDFWRSIWIFSVCSVNSSAVTSYSSIS